MQLQAKEEVMVCWLKEHLQESGEEAQESLAEEKAQDLEETKQTVML